MTQDFQGNTSKDAKNITDLVAENIQQLKEETCQNDIIKSGFDDFDRLFGGFRLGELVIVGGRPAMGKTQFLVNLSLNISVTHPVLYVTLDMSDFLLTNRFIASVSKIPADLILQNKLNEEQKNMLFSIGNEFTKRQLLILDRGNTIASLKAHCQKQIQENGIRVFIVDYLQLMRSNQHRSNRENEMSYISRELKNMAKEHNVCVIASSQLSRVLEYRTGLINKHQQLYDLRESGEIEQDADKVLFIHRPEYYGFTKDCDGNSLRNLVEIIVAKNRSGRLGDFCLLRDKNFTNFQNYEVKDELFPTGRLLELDEEPPF
jgi:replicative DNA helicase